MIVFDASVGLKRVLVEADSDKALAIQVELIAPDIFPIECSHALVRAERKGVIQVGEAELLLGMVMTDLPRLYPSLPLLPRAVELASKLRKGVYDCLYVALAEREGCDFVTADERLIKDLQGQFTFVISLADFSRS
jgi:predicted nucleic acid-binding protein